jgi:hypothetical protein
MPVLGQCYAGSSRLPPLWETQFMHSPPAKYLVLIDASGAMTARLFDAQLRPLMDFDATTEEVPAMLAGLSPQQGATSPDWVRVLAGHSERERREAQVYTLAV